MFKISLLFFFLLSICFAQKNTELHSIEQLLWKNRVILIWSNGNIQKLEDKFALNDYQIKDRHILWFIIKQNKVYSNYQGTISKSFLASVNSNYFTNKGNVLLVGKDGYVKDVSQEVNLKDIYRLIDGMHMRQLEMKR